MVPDQGCYEERYRLTFPVARSTAFSLVPLIIAIFRHQPLPWVILAPVIFVLATVPWLLAVASRRVAFRADTAGIMLGADPLSWPFRHASAVFVPWCDAEGIALYQGAGRSAGISGTIRASGSSAARVPSLVPRQQPCPPLPGAERRSRGRPPGHCLAAGPRRPCRGHRGGSARHPHHRREYWPEPGR